MRANVLVGVDGCTHNMGKSIDVGIFSTHLSVCSCMHACVCVCVSLPVTPDSAATPSVI